MHRKVINLLLFLPLALCINSLNALSSETKPLKDKFLEEKAKNPLIKYQNLEKYISKNPELKSFQNLITSASFNLSSQIAKDTHP